MIGGLFAGLIAPFAFSWVTEYPILLVLAALCRPIRQFGWQQRDRLFWAVAAALGLALLAPGLLFGWMPQGQVVNVVLITIIIVALASLVLMRHPFKLPLASPLRSP